LFVGIGRGLIVVVDIPAENARCRLIEADSYSSRCAGGHGFGHGNWVLAGKRADGLGRECSLRLAKDAGLRPLSKGLLKLPALPLGRRRF
jgi:hypothetical protein